MYMNHDEIVKDVYKKLKIKVENIDLRTEIQNEIVKIDAKILLCELATGFGKSLIALKRIKNRKCLILISQLYHEQNWRNDAIKHNIDISNCVFTCYNSLAKYKNEDWPIIVADEFHRHSDNWSETLLEFNYDEFIGLSGTIPLEIKKKAYNLGKPTFVSISTEDAVSWNILPEPEINVINLYLDNKLPNQIFEKGKNKQKNTINCTYSEWNRTYKWQGSKRPNLRIQCTEQEYYTLVNDDLEWNKSQFFKTKNAVFGMRMKILGNQRKSFLANLKTKYVQKLIQKVNGRIVVFASSIEQAEQLDKDAVHSQNKNGQQIIEEFNSYKRDLLVSIRQLSESMNLVEPDNGIIIQLDNSKEGSRSKTSVANQQRLGRLLRSDIPKLYVFCYKHTQDEVYLEKFKESLDSKWFKNYTI